MNNPLFQYVLFFSLKCLVKHAKIQQMQPISITHVCNAYLSVRKSRDWAVNVLWCFKNSLLLMLQCSLYCYFTQSKNIMYVSNERVQLHGKVLRGCWTKMFDLLFEIRIEAMFWKKQWISWKTSVMHYFNFGGDNNSFLD